MIRVLMIAPRFESTDRGVEVFARYLAIGLNKDRFEVTVLSGPHSSAIKDVRCIQFPLISREALFSNLQFLLKYFPARFLCNPVDLEALSLMWRARHFLKEQSFDVIMPYGGTWTYRFAKFFQKKAKIISVGHAGPVKKDLKLSDVFVALTPTDQENAIRLVPSIQTMIIPNGVDLNSFYPNKTNAKNRNKKIILCVGAFSVDKRQELLLDALEFLDPEIWCLLVGKGPRKKFLQSHPQAKLGRVEFLELPHEQMPALYQQADLFTLPALNEAFGLVFLEALASGLAVVANDAPRQRFVIGETGIYCDVTNPWVYANALQAGLATPYNESRTLQAKKFTWDDVIGRYQVLLEDINGKRYGA